MSERAPVFSVIIPTYNRSRLVLRAIGSALTDQSDDYEVIVVDDCSTDDTVHVLSRLHDARLRVITCADNGGCCVARNIGARAARGDWLIFLDSDDELTPDAMINIRRRAFDAPLDVGKLLFACRFDGGNISPQPAMTGDVVDYVGYVRWQESTVDGLSEALPCTRRLAFLQSPYSETRGWLEGLHELNFAQHFRVQLCPEVVRLYHADAPTRLMVFDDSVPSSKFSGYAGYLEAVLSEHGETIRRHSPRRWADLLRGVAIFNFVAGNRTRGIRGSWLGLRASPANSRTWFVLIAGTLSPWLLRRIWTARRAQITQ